MMAKPNNKTVTAQQLWFTAPQQVEIREQVLAPPGAGELLVQSCCSAISAGTELLVYRGQLPTDMALDASLASLQQTPTYPLQYGYACVGRVVQTGAEVDAAWQGRLVFAFAPHCSHFISTPEQLIALPEDIAPLAAVFLANMETAVNLVQDGNPGLGERVVVLGQGVVGLLLTALLAQYPLSDLVALDALALRRSCALALGASQALDPHCASEMALLEQQLAQAQAVAGADLVYEVTGVPEALNTAVSLSGFASRIIIGSWYGNKTAPVMLGAQAHRNRLQISTSQVSTIAPELSGRWNKQRRFELAWQMLRKVQTGQLITHQLALSDAPAIYQQLHTSTADIVQAVFIYP